MIRVEVLNVCMPGDCARLENIMNEIHVTKNAVLIDMEKVYNPKENTYLVFIMYRLKTPKPEFLYTPQRVLTPSEDPPVDTLPEYPKIEV